MGAPGTVALNTNQYIVLFDGVCNLCNGAVQFIIKRDTHNKFLFASLQSAFAKEHLQKAGYTISEPNSIVLVKGDQLLQRSNAVLEILRQMKGLWPLLYAFKIIPVFLRDPVYNFIARNRYKFFGKKDSCMVPEPQWKSKFIE